LKMFNASTGSSVVNETRLTVNPYDQTLPRAAISSVSGLGLAVWQDARSGNGDIYYQRFNITTGALIGSNTILVNDSYIEKSPDVAVDSSGTTAVVTWYQVSNYTDSYEVFAMLVNLSSNTYSGVINVSVDKHDQYNPRVDVFNDLALIFFENGVDGIYNHLYYQLLNTSSGMLVGNNTKVSSSAPTSISSWYQFALKEDVVIEQDKAYLMWDDYGNIYLRTFNMTRLAFASNQVTLLTFINARQPSLIVDPSLGTGVVTYATYGYRDKND